MLLSKIIIIGCFFTELTKKVNGMFLKLIVHLLASNKNLQLSLSFCFNRYYPLLTNSIQ